MGLRNTTSNPFFTQPKQNLQREQSFLPLTSQPATGQALQFGQRPFTPPTQTGGSAGAKKVLSPQQPSATQQLSAFKAEFQGHNLLSPTRAAEFSPTFGGGLSETGKFFSAIA